MSKPYKTCPTCGAHLDHGEICECQVEEAKEAARQASGNPHKPAHAA